MQRNKSNGFHISFLAVACLLLITTLINHVSAASSVPSAVLRSTESVVRVEAKYSDEYVSGSGFIIQNAQNETYVATNYHVVDENPSSIYIWTDDDETATAKIYAYSDQCDLCILKLSRAVSMDPLVLAVNGVAQGDAVYAVGFPSAADDLSDFEARTSDEATITDGIVSAIRSATIIGNGDAVEILQISAAINSGNSGGPLFDTKGQVVGINTYSTYDSQGIFGAIAVDELVKLMESKGIAPYQPYSDLLVALPACVLLIIVILVVVLTVIKRKKKVNAPDSSVSISAMPRTENQQTTQCVHCGRIIDWNNEFCQFCGTKVQRSTVQKPTSNPCNVCGAENPLDRKFCASCGNQLPVIDHLLVMSPQKTVVPNFVSDAARQEVIANQRHFDSDYGYSEDNPFIVSSVQMEGCYLYAFRSSEGKAFTWERQPKTAASQIDAYKLFVDGEFYKELFFNPNGTDTEHLPVGITLNADAFEAAQQGITIEQFLENKAAAEAKLKAKQDRRKKAKRRMKRAAIALGCFVLLAAGVFAAYQYGYPLLRYTIAGRNLEKGNYESAIAVYEDLGTYRDSENMLLQAKYQLAYDLFEREQFEEAKEQFSLIEDYQDASDMMKACTYGIAMQHMSAGNYQEAITRFKSLDDYKDARQKIAECYYELLLSQMKDDNMAAAYMSYGYIEDYDNADNYDLSSYMYDVFMGYAEVQMERGTEASCRATIEVLDELVQNDQIEALDRVHISEVKAEADQKLTQILYERGQADLSAGNYRSAMEAFAEILDYEDSQTQWLEAMYQCVHSKTGLIFISPFTEEYYTYAETLSDFDYKDSKEYYKELTAWGVVIVMNADKDDPTAHPSSISKYDNMCAHVTVFGGPLDGIVELKYVFTMPNGNVLSDTWDFEIRAGDTVTAWCYYNNPQYGSIGTCYVKIYNNATGELLGSDSIRVTN